ncbi:hypothetical protein DITRI_Ditri07aG0145100 [Diplodiscus trichospermus]
MKLVWSRSSSLFILINAITVAVVVGIHKPSIDEFDQVLQHWCSLCEVGASFDNNMEVGSDVNVFEDYTWGSDGYNGDDDDDSWYEEEEEEDDDDDLQKRIEDFIAKVNNGGREERLKEKDCEQEQLRIG